VSPGVGGAVASASGLGGPAGGPAQRVSLSVGTVGVTQPDICPEDLRDIDSNDKIIRTIISRTSNLKQRGLADQEDVENVFELLTASDVDNEVIAETLTAGDDEALKFFLELRGGSAESVDEFIELAGDADIPRDDVRTFAQLTGQRGALLFDRLDASQLKAFFELDFAQATLVRKKLAEFASGGFSQFTADEAARLVTDIRALKSERPDLSAAIERAYISDIASQPVTDSGLNNVIGDLLELNIARRLVDLDRDSVETLEVDGGPVTYTDIRDGEVTRDVEIDVQAQNALIESKFGSVDNGIINQIRKYKQYRDNVLQDPDREIVVVVRDKSEISDDLSQRISEEGARVLEPDQLSEVVG
jgi:hypothetical protein